jgi:hypothetical protein
MTSLEAKIHNERTKLLTAYFNAVAAAILVGGSLLVLVSLTTQAGTISRGAECLMVGSLFLSPVAHLIGRLCLGHMVEET